MIFCGLRGIVPVCRGRTATHAGAASAIAPWDGFVRCRFFNLHNVCRSSRGIGGGLPRIADDAPEQIALGEKELARLISQRRVTKMPHRCQTPI